MSPSLIAQLHTILISLATAAASITPLPAQQGITQQTTFAPQIGSASASQNWAGYVATTGNYTSISGTWTVPQATDSGHTATDATWVGIGGVNSSDLIQAGTQNVISPSGQVTTTAFYELLPNASDQVSNLSIKPGDSITTTITQQSSGQWLITITDTTTNQNYQTTVRYNSSLSSAEWIEEAPSDGQSVLPLDNFGTVSITGGAVTQNGSQQSIAGSSAHAITMVNEAGQAIATTSALGNDEASFTVTRTTAISTAPIPGFDRDPGIWRRHGRGIGHGFHFIKRSHYQQSQTQQTPAPSISPEPTEEIVRVFRFPRRGTHFRFHQ